MLDMDFGSEIKRPIFCLRMPLKEHQTLMLSAMFSRGNSKFGWEVLKVELSVAVGQVGWSPQR